MTPAHKQTVLAAMAVILAARDEIRERCAATTWQKIESAVVETQSVVNDSVYEPQPEPAPAPAPVVDVQALAAAVAPIVSADVAAAVVAAMQPAPTGA